MNVKIKEDYVAKARSDRIKAYLLSKALRKEDCTDAEVKKIYKLSDVEFDVAVEILITEGIVEK